jgi:hypothetical protein
VRNTAQRPAANTPAAGPRRQTVHNPAAHAIIARRSPTLRTASPSRTMTTLLKQKLARGDVAIAVNLGGRNPDIVEHLARLGADVAFIDCERTGIGLDAAADGLLVVELLQQVVGAPGQDAEHIARLLCHGPGRDTRVEPHGVPAAGEGHRALEDPVVLRAPGRRRV